MATGIPMDVWEEAGPRGVATALELLEEANSKGDGKGGQDG